MHADAPAGTAPRRRAVDAMRGIVMIVMALDHLRDYLGDAHFDATDLSQTTAPLFITRWITHFCAPAFFLLAGISAYASIQGGRRTLPEAARFLATRGVALVVLEQTVMHLAWYFHFDYHFMNANVLFGLGLSMVAMSLLVRLPPVVSLVVGIAIVLGEAAIARLDLGGGALGTIVALATRSQDFEPVSGYHFFVSYPPIPWLGAMAFGYGLGDLVYRHAAARIAPLLGFGAGFLALFVVVRALGVLDPSPWTAQPDALFTVLSFVNVSKYPPSTPFLLLTLGVAMLGLAAFERWTRDRPARLSHVVETYGRVPLFFYVIHIPLIHLIAVVYSYVVFAAATWLISGPVIFWDTALPGSPPSYGLGLPWIYIVWMAFVAALYPVCRWFGDNTRRSADPDHEET
jgi:uncharacterized membrane protein